MSYESKMMNLNNAKADTNLIILRNYQKKLFRYHGIRASSYCKNPTVLENKICSNHAT